ncbi:MAG: D-alanyl-D-alanine carboxypeptidase [Parcubacteria group bacterium]|nr:D-alanyl-D-alanine carboxypeptidase [Parcubacteria group bacterium]
MSFVSVLFAIASLLFPPFPFSDADGAYVSNGSVRADRVRTTDDASRPPVKIDRASLGPRISARSAIVVDAKSGAVLYEKDASALWPVASIAKLMAAVVFLESGPNLGERLTMVPEDDREGGNEFIRPGQSATARDFLVASLLGSANNATITLARSAPAEAGAFVERMNVRARELGMRNTVFTEPSGLEPENTSTAEDLVRLLAEAGKHPAITDIIGTHRDTIRVFPEGAAKAVLTTNHLLGTIVLVAYGKTGHLDESGFNLATAVDTAGGHRLYIVTLGSQTNEDRVQDAKSLAVWAQNTYQW